MQIITKEFLLFPDDLRDEDVESHINTDKSGGDLFKQPNEPNGNSSLGLAIRIAAGFPASDFMKREPRFTDRLGDRSTHSLVIKGGIGGGIFVYHWSPTDRLVFPVIRGRILLSRGDLEWIGAYPFISGIDLFERTVNFICKLEDHYDTSSLSLFLTSRVHFGHLARDTIAGEAYLALAYIEKCRDINKNVRFSFLGMPDEYLEEQLYFSLSLILKETKSKLERINHPHTKPGTALIIRRSLLFVRSLSPTFPCFDLQRKLGIRSQINHSAVQVAHLGIRGSPHKRILNREEISRFLEERKIPSIEPYHTPADRHSLLCNASIVVAEPSSSIYNYILNCSLDTLCILLLPAAFERELSHRDCCDWAFAIKHLMKKRVVPFYGECTDPATLLNERNKDRHIDTPTRYDTKDLGILLDQHLSKADA